MHAFIKRKTGCSNETASTLLFLLCCFVGFQSLLLNTCTLTAVGFSEFLLRV